MRDPNRWKRWLDLTLYLLLVGLCVTGAIMKWKLPPGSRGGHGLSLWGWDRHQWGELHFILALILVALLVLHLFLNWRWVCMVACRGRTVWAWIVILLGILFVGGVFLLPVEQSPRGTGEGRGGPWWHESEPSLLPQQGPEEGQQQREKESNHSPRRRGWQRRSAEEVSSPTQMDYSSSGAKENDRSGDTRYRAGKRLRLRGSPGVGTND